MTTPVFTLRRQTEGRSYYQRIVGPNGVRIGPTFGDTSGSREAAPWLVALQAAYQLGQDGPSSQLSAAIGTISELQVEVLALRERRSELHATNDAMTAKVLGLQKELGKAEAMLLRLRAERTIGWTSQVCANSMPVACQSDESNGSAQ